MTFDRIFEEQFQAAADDALKVASSGGKREGISFGFASGLIYMSEALLFYIGAILIANGTYTYLQMVQTLNLLLFTVTIGSQLLAFSEFIIVNSSLYLTLPPSQPHSQSRPRHQRTQPTSSSTEFRQGVIRRSPPLQHEPCGLPRCSFCIS